jgi:hypothetical protein
MQSHEVHSATMTKDTRSPFTLSILVSVGGMLLGWGITWGNYSQRLEMVERTERELKDRADKLENLALIHDRQLAEQRVQFAEILRRLERIEGKIERGRVHNSAQTIADRREVILL